jgi:hypothetical protein
MSHYITVPINENGIIFDIDMVAVVQEAIAVSPFGFEDVYVYSHGWSTDAYGALDLYNRFSVDLAKLLLLTGGTGVYAAPPRARRVRSHRRRRHGVRRCRRGERRARLHGNGSGGDRASARRRGSFACSPIPGQQRHLHDRRLLRQPLGLFVCRGLPADLGLPVRSRLIVRRPHRLGDRRNRSSGADHRCGIASSGGTCYGSSSAAPATTTPGVRTTTR